MNTTLISSSFLQSSCELEFSERIHELMQTVTKFLVHERSETELVERIKTILSIGASSGLDLLFGILFGLEIQKRRKQA